MHKCYILESKLANIELNLYKEHFKMISIDKFVYQGNIYTILTLQTSKQTLNSLFLLSGCSVLKHTLEMEI